MHHVSFIIELVSCKAKMLDRCLCLQLAKMIDLGSNATIRDLSGFYTFELTTETDVAGIQRNIFQVNRIHESHFSCFQLLCWILW